MTAASTVPAVLSHLSGGRAGRPVTLIGFDASRHLTRHPFAVPPTVIDMPICEETIAGLALGMAAAGHDVVIDLMFEGFLGRCLEPLAVGLPTARSFAPVPLGRLIVRALGGPIPFGGPSHANSALQLIMSLEGVSVVYVADEADLAWALGAQELADDVLVLIDLPLASLLTDGKRIYLQDGCPGLLWERGADTLLVCTHAAAQTLLSSTNGAGHEADVLSLAIAPRCPVASMSLSREYRQVSWSRAGSVGC